MPATKKPPKLNLNLLVSRKDRIFAELNLIGKQNDGRITPQAVVEFAKNPKTALHGYFEWDDTAAAEKYRLQQARHILRIQVTVISPIQTPVRAWLSLPSERGPGGGYAKTIEIISDASRREELLKMALNDLAIFKIKYGVLVELSTVFAEIDKTTAHHGKKEKKKETG